MSNKSNKLFKTIGMENIRFFGRLGIWKGSNVEFENQKGLIDYAPKEATNVNEISSAQKGRKGWGAYQGSCRLLQAY